jgi:hypothetical protein
VTYNCCTRLPGEYAQKLVKFQRHTQRKNYNYHKAVLSPMDVSCHHVILRRKTMSKQKLPPRHLAQKNHVKTEAGSGSGLLVPGKNLDDQ